MFDELGLPVCLHEDSSNYLHEKYDLRFCLTYIFLFAKLGEKLKQLEHEKGIVVRFMIGRR